jgi:hypothetical protein
MLLQKSIKKYLQTLSKEGVTPYNSTGFAENRQAIKTAIYERTPKLIAIIIANYQQTLEQVLLSDEVANKIYESVAYEVDEEVSTLANDVGEELTEFISTLTPTHSSIIDSVTDTKILDALKYAMTENQAVLNDQFDALHDAIMGKSSDHEANMEALDNNTNLTTLNTGN